MHSQSIPCFPSYKVASRSVEHSLSKETSRESPGSCFVIRQAQLIGVSKPGKYLERKHQLKGIVSPNWSSRLLGPGAFSPAQQQAPYPEKQLNWFPRISKKKAGEMAWWVKVPASKWTDSHGGKKPPFYKHLSICTPTPRINQ